MMKAHARKITCNAGDKVFVRMDKKHDKFAGKQYLVVTGTIIKRCKNDMYEVQLEHLVTQIKNCQSRLFIPFLMADPTRSFNNQGYIIPFDPQDDRNYQLATVAFALQRFGIIRAAIEIGMKLLGYSSQNSLSPDMHLKLYSGVHWSTYLQRTEIKK